MFKHFRSSEDLDGTNVFRIMIPLLEPRFIPPPPAPDDAIIGMKQSISLCDSFYYSIALLLGKIPQYPINAEKIALEL